MLTLHLRICSTYTVKGLYHLSRTVTIYYLPIFNKMINLIWTIILKRNTVAIIVIIAPYFFYYMSISQVITKFCVIKYWKAFEIPWHNYGYNRPFEASLFHKSNGAGSLFHLFLIRVVNFFKTVIVWNWDKMHNWCMMIIFSILKIGVNY